MTFSEMVSFMNLQMLHLTADVYEIVPENSRYVTDIYVTVIPLFEMLRLPLSIRYWSHNVVQNFRQLRQPNVQEHVGYLVCMCSVKRMHIIIRLQIEKVPARTRSRVIISSLLLEQCVLTTKEYSHICNSIFCLPLRFSMVILCKPYGIVSYREVSTFETFLYKRCRNCIQIFSVGSLIQNIQYRIKPLPSWESSISLSSDGYFTKFAAYNSKLS
ncbi:hypothetical protein BDF20DRAFT_831424 [Mycotypha africana]|uniref:uncharacterized protein n=1 Tax=Mycotypha africana TaxID=64632 RepID=UPI0023000AC4|nr:uncharacterized protein BDF20DRAFT_831424 [Mycotypha africana]KAI8991378.1 hypothetical protein BDF20DRAFT_831424 [Mycotypha africana]